MSEGYDVQAVEAKWQQVWDERGTYEIDEDDPRPKFYDLCMYPYPSGPIHMGHVRNYTLGDVICRHRTMNGYAVLCRYAMSPVYAYCKYMLFAASVPVE